MAKKFYVTTPIYYPNDIPHVGHAYTTIVADVLSRWNKIRGKDVLFTTGVDDHGMKVLETAKENNLPPKEFVDKIVPRFKDAWEKLNIDYSRFIRTTDKDHKKIVQNILQKIYDKGEIYLGEYEGYYCVGCEAYLTEKELENGCCPIHKKKVKKLKEETYFFKIQNYKDRLLKLYEKGFILPKNKTSEMVHRVKELDRDLSISRTSFDWGIPVPFDKKHVTYVWFDALLNYYTSTQEKNRQDFWPCDLHIVAKDIFYFHAVMWPAILMAADLPVPKNLFVHGYWTFGKEKISKSRGKVINVDELIALTGNVDSVRYFLLRATPFGKDGDFSEKALVERHNNELADKLGNLVSRVSGLIEKEGCKQNRKWKTPFLTVNVKKDVGELMENFEFDKVLNRIFAYVDSLNKWVQDEKPWEIHEEDFKRAVLYNLKEGILLIAELLWPFIPESSEKITKQFSSKNIKKGEILFKKV
ncbi:methionine--tRNA ligase [Candidatus Pacearchaeota archaeon]|nr:methionine--tRNA ligase [Candidatus Pacearchaeota archaeon]